MSEPEIPWWANQLGAKSIRITELEAEVGRLREHHEKSIEVGLHLADDSNHWVKVADKLQARIDAALVDCDCAIADYHDDSMGAYGTMADRLLGALQSARAALAGADE